jgi:hypothetical protein
MTDGVYRAYVDERGNEVHESVKRAFTDATPTAPIRRQSETGTTRCGCGFNLVPGDCDAAVADMENQLGGGVTFSDSAYYSIRGAVVAFACAKNGRFTINSSQFSDFVSDVTSACGRYVAGTWIDLTGGGDTGDVGYMQYSAGLDFCANAEGSNEPNCWVLKEQPRTISEGLQ